MEVCVFYIVASALFATMSAISDDVNGPDATTERLEPGMAIAGPTRISSPVDRAVGDGRPGNDDADGLHIEHLAGYEPGGRDRRPVRSQQGKVAG